jgi:hypothetical protein
MHPSMFLAAVTPADRDVAAFTSAGVDRLIVSPWARRRVVPDALVDAASRFLG